MKEIICRPIMKSNGTGITLYEPPATIDEINWKGPDTLKEEFLAEWKESHELEVKVGGNAGINQLDVLDFMQNLLIKGKLDTTKSYSILRNETIDLMFK